MMRLARLALVMAFFSSIVGCAELKRLLPQGPVLSERQRTALEAAPGDTLRYTSAPLLPYPILPVQVWAATYALDVIVVSNHPDWNMHEFAKLRTPGGDLWLMKDADNDSLSQFIVADVPDIHTWLPEIPVGRKSFPVRVEERLEGKRFGLKVDYENRRGERVQAEYYGKIPRTRQGKRNGSTMGHSRNDIIAVLDLPVRDFGSRASISYGGKAYGIKRLLGLIPFQMALSQTQGGISRGNYKQSPMPYAEGFLTLYPQGDAWVQRAWTLRDSGAFRVAEQHDPQRLLQYVFKKLPQERLELQRACVRQWDCAPGEESFAIHFFPALPDMRCRFEGKFVGAFVMDVGGRRNHARGSLKAYWQDEVLHLDIIPTAPWWVADRPTHTRISIRDGDKVEILNRE